MDRGQVQSGAKQVGALLDTAQPYNPFRTPGSGVGQSGYNWGVAPRLGSSTSSSISSAKASSGGSVGRGVTPQAEIGGVSEPVKYGPQWDTRGNHDDSMGKAPHVYMDGTNNSAADQFTMHTPKSRPGMGSRINYGPKLGTEIPGIVTPQTYGG